MFTRIVEVEIELVGRHVSELAQGFEGKPRPIKKVDRAPIPPRKVSSYWCNLVFDPIGRTMMLCIFKFGFGSEQS